MSSRSLPTERLDLIWSAPPRALPAASRVRQQARGSAPLARSLSLPPSAPRSSRAARAARQHDRCCGGPQ
eukprot:1916818-Pyramimonas_sp.AAC.1